MLVELRDVLSRDEAESLSLTENQVLFARLGRGIEDVLEEALVLGGCPGEAHEQCELGRYHQSSLLPDLAVRGLFRGLAILDATANETPCVGKVRSVSVAVLQQDTPLGVHQEHKRGIMGTGHRPIPGKLFVHRSPSLRSSASSMVVWSG